MADPLSITASVIAVTQFAFSSAKGVYQTISDFHDGPPGLLSLKSDLDLLSGTISSFQQELEKRQKKIAKAKETEKEKKKKKKDADDTATLSEAEMKNLVEIKPSLEECQRVCDGFNAKINKIFRHSKVGDISFRDKLKLMFQEKEFVTFRTQISNFKSTLEVSIGFLNFKSISENLDHTKALESKIENLTTRLAGQIQGLQIGMQAIIDSVPLHIRETQEQPEQLSNLLDIIKHQDVVLAHCLSACMAALQGTAKVTGHKYEYVTATENANLILGDVGKVESDLMHSYSNLDVREGHVVAGNVGSEIAKHFFR